MYQKQKELSTEGENPQKYILLNLSMLDRRMMARLRKKRVKKWGAKPVCY
jgi:hypothetical protein